MGREKAQRPTLAAYGASRKYQPLTGGSTGTTIAREGVTLITLTTGEGTAAAALAFTLADPEITGTNKTIQLVVPGASTKTVTVQTSVNLKGTTGMTWTWNSSGVGTPQSVELVGVSTTAWALINAYPAGSTILSFGT